MNKSIALLSISLALLGNSVMCCAAESPATNTSDADALLLKAAFKNDYDKALKALKRNANVNSIGSAGLTALAWSVYNGNLKLVQLLVEKGADVHFKDSDNNTLLHTALTPQTYEEMVMGKPHKYTLSTLAQRGDMVAFLLKKGVDPTLEDNSATLPVHMAVVRGSGGDYHDQIKLITLLLPNKALLKHKNQYGRTPIDMARDPKIKAYLLSLLNE